MDWLIEVPKYEMAWHGGIISFMDHMKTDALVVYNENFTRKNGCFTKYVE